MRTVGISPKVKLPAWALSVVGGVLLVIGLLLGGNDGGTVRDMGIALLAGGPIGGLIGYQAPPAGLTSPDHPSAPKRGPQA
jgi:hypothetical protein